MIIDRPKTSQAGALRQLWQEAFGDEDGFLDDFRDTALSAQRCRCVSIGSSLAAALYWFDCEHLGEKIAYIYAVATAKAFRKQGICRKLMENTHAHLASLGYAGAILVPDGERLFAYYAGLGYAPCGGIRELRCTAASEASAIRKVDAREYAALRAALLPQGGVIQEGENLAFLATMAELYAGQDFLLAARKEGDALLGLELLGDAAAAPGILRALGCSRGSFRTPGESPFAMYRPLGESTLPAPSYFGLAFD